MARGSGGTETGAYTLLGGTPSPSNGGTVTRNAGAKIFVTSEDEWYKAAYYYAPLTRYFAYPTGVDAGTPTCTTPTVAINSANCSGAGAVNDETNKGSYTSSPSSYGTFDQGGNVWEWTEAISGSGRVLRGGSFDFDANYLAASYPGLTPNPVTESGNIGFRVSIGETSWILARSPRSIVTSNVPRGGARRSRQPEPASGPIAA